TARSSWKACASLGWTGRHGYLFFFPFEPEGVPFAITVDVSPAPPGVPFFLDRFDFRIIGSLDPLRRPTASSSARYCAGTISSITNHAASVRSSTTAPPPPSEDPLMPVADEGRVPFVERDESRRLRCAAAWTPTADSIGRDLYWTTTNPAFDYCIEQLQLQHADVMFHGSEWRNRFDDEPFEGRGNG
ncbi:hypothetical protein CF319_g8828, partial [Tilletia indica]